MVLDSRLSGLSVAALRRYGTPLIAMRPVVHLLRFPEMGCVQVNRAGHATVLAVSTPGLSNTVLEGQLVARILHTTSATGPAATRSVLFAARNDAVLHLAAHGGVQGDHGSIQLADGDVSGLEILGRRVAPSLAVLSVCDASSSNAPELAGSLAAGFLGAGSQHVVATLRQVSDAGALQIAERFYDANGIADPAHALAAAQSDLVATTNTDWPYFVVFGPAVCSAAQ
jgi:CHAT domain-containing protein